MSLLPSSPSLPDTITNIKLIIALGCGLGCGIHHPQGSTGILSFMVLSGLAGLRAAKRAGVDEDEVGGKVPILLDGFMPSLALFILIWTLLFNALM